MNHPLLITRKEAAERLGVTPESVSNYVRRGILKRPNLEGSRTDHITYASFHNLELQLADITECQQQAEKMKQRMQQAKAEYYDTWRQFRRQTLLVCFSERFSPLIKEIMLFVSSDDDTANRRWRIAMAALEGDSTLEEIADREGVTRARVIQLMASTWKTFRSMAKNYRGLEAENKQLRERIETLKTANTSLSKKLDDQHLADVYNNTELSPIFSTKVSDMSYSIRVQNCLKAADIETIGELVEKTERELIECRNFGKKSLGELRDSVESLGLRFGMTHEDKIDYSIQKLQCP